MDRTLTDLNKLYAQAFGAREYYRDAESVQVLGSGTHDVIESGQLRRRLGFQPLACFQPGRFSGIEIAFVGGLRCEQFQQPRF
jgi:hypothetical protein